MAVSLSLLAGAGWQFLDDNANPLTGGLLYTYAAGTTTPLATYTSSSGATPNANPIVLDAAGRVPQEVWLSTTSDYKFILKNSTGVTVWTKDDIPGGLSSDAVMFLQAGTGAVTRTAQAKMREVVSAKDFGALGNGVADDTVPLQAALNYLGTVGGGVLVLETGVYRSKYLNPGKNTTIFIEPDATLAAISQPSFNFLFLLGNSVTSTTSLTTALSGAVQITVASTSSFSVNDTVMVTTGTFTGTAPEDGPMEFNTVRSIDSPTTMTLARPLQYSYTAFGFPGQAPRVDNLGNKNNVKRNIRITGGGKITPDTISGFNSYYFNLSYAIDVEIDHIVFENQGSTIASGGRCSGLKFHHNVGYGNSNPGFATHAFFNVATLTESIISDNIVQYNVDPVGGYALNSFVLEVGCRDNIVCNNIIGPVTGDTTAAIGFTFNSFGNKIQNNIIYGRATDIAANLSSLGIRTFANNTASSIPLPANVITGNTIRNIMTAIGDANPLSVIANNLHENDTLAAFSTTYLTTSAGSEVVAFGNVGRNIQRPSFLNTGVPGGFIVFSGTTDPDSNSGAVGSAYFKRDGAAGQTAWFKEVENGSPAWVPRNRLPSVTFANVGTPANGTMLYVTDGTAGSSPLTGGGTGCVAIRQNGAWKGL